MKHRYCKVATGMLSFLALAVLLTGCGAKDMTSITTATQLNDSDYTVGVAQGAASQFTAEQALPNAKIKYYTRDPDAYLAVQQKKIDAFVYDRVTMTYAMASGLTGVMLLPDNLGEPIHIAVGISPKTPIPDLETKINDFIAQSKEDGTLDDMFQRWVYEATDIIPDIPKPKNPTLTLKVATSGLVQPFSYYKGDQLCGYDIEFIYRFALWMNANVEISTYDYGGIYAPAENGSIDCIIANLNVTEERKQSILFSDTIYESYSAVMVLDNGTTAEVPDRIPVETARIGVMDGSTNEIYAEQHYPDADRQNYKNYVDSCAALSAGKLDYAMMDYTNALRFTRSYPDLEIASEFLTDEKLCIGISQDNSKLYAEVNDVMNRFLADGTVDAAIDHWIKPDGSDYDIVETPKLPNAPKIKVAIVSSREPTTFMMNDQFVGLDIEIIDRILYELGYQPEYMDMEWGAVIVAIGSGKADMTLGMYNTPERAEKLLFTEPYFTNPQLLVTRKVNGTGKTETTDGYTSLSQLSGKKFACVTGTIFDQLTLTAIPDARISYFNSSADILKALKDGRVEGIVVDEPVAELLMARNSDLAIVPELVAEDSYGMALMKDSPMTAYFNREIGVLKESGVLDELFDKWVNADESTTLPSFDYPAPNGKMRVACSVEAEPMCYVGGDGVPLGFEVELIVRVAQAMGKKVEFTSVDFSSLIPMVQSGKVDVAMGCMSITDERKQSLDMTDPYHDGGVAVIVHNAESATVGESALGSLKQSFIRTFVTENRWKLVLNGLVVTVVLSICSGILGSILGFGICMLRRSKRRLVSIPTAVFIRIIQGTPIVVMLMILYYIIFGKLDISAILVAILGFAVNFGVYVSEMIRTGIDAVDKGQIEAAHALGFTRVRTFWKITFPQAARHFLPVFKGEFISMVKMTSVVGYIAIQDLTKVSDIIRSRTLEAFFPLIATAVLYFIVANLLTILLSRLEIRLDPKRRKRIVKGVVTK